MNTTMPPVPEAIVAPARLTPDERAQIEAFDTQRRLNLLRLLVPAFLVLAAISLPLALYSDINGALTDHLVNGEGAALSFHFYGTVQDSAALVPLIFAFIALRRQQVQRAALFFVAGVSLDIILVIFIDSFLPGPLALRSIPEFAELVIPIALAGLLSGPRLLLGTTAGALTFALADFLLAQHDPALSATLAQSDGIAVIIIPLFLLVALAVIMASAASGLRRAQVELNTVRIAYAREVELDRLKNQFISNVNHELRTPIMALQGYITLARELGARGELARQGQLLDRGQEALVNLAALVESVLNVRQIEADQPDAPLVPVDARDAITRALSLLDPRAAGPTERPLRLDLPAGLHVLARPERLSQVMLNLVSNACKYSPPGSPIEITARLHAAEARSDGAALVAQFAVRDYGLGIPQEQIPLLFQRFVRLQRDIASPVIGSGLGLAICKAAIEAMGGTIWVESSGIPGEGSTFYFTLAALPI
jgi:signal transduction histidine kinase